MFTRVNGGNNDMSMNCFSLSNDANKLPRHSFLAVVLLICWLPSVGLLQPTSLKTPPTILLSPNEKSTCNNQKDKLSLMVNETELFLISLIFYYISLNFLFCCPAVSSVLKELEAHALTRDKMHIFLIDGISKGTFFSGFIS